MYVDLSELPKILYLVAALGFLIAVFIAVRRRLRRRAHQFGCHGILGYFRAVPREDAEKRDAVDRPCKASCFVCWESPSFPCC